MRSLGFLLVCCLTLPFVGALVGACDHRKIPKADRGKRTCTEVAEDAYDQCTSAAAASSRTPASFDQCNAYSLQMFEACQREKNCLPQAEISDHDNYPRPEVTP